MIFVPFIVNPREITVHIQEKKKKKKKKSENVPQDSAKSKLSQRGTGVRLD